MTDTTAKAPDSDSKSILIVDDEPVYRHLLKQFLTDTGATLAFASDGMQALAMLPDVQPDLILADVRMPGMDGFELSRQVKSDKRFCHVPIILLTSLGSQTDVIQGLEAGADEFLQKIVNAPELRARVQSMLRIKQQHDELEEALKLKEDLANMIVHDMRNPLAALILAGSLLKRTAEDERSQRYLDEAMDAAHRLEDFMNDLLTAAKGSENKLVLHKKMVDIPNLVEDVRYDENRLAIARGITLEADNIDGDMQVFLDRTLLRRTLDNLMSNSLKFAPEESTITIQSKMGVMPDSSTPCACISVIDQGPGIPEEYRDKVFDRFQIVKMQQKNVAQVGLGLAFCKMAVHAHDGLITVDNNEPQGSIFTIRIPITPAEDSS